MVGWDSVASQRGVARDPWVLGMVSAPKLFKQYKETTQGSVSKLFTQLCAHTTHAPEHPHVLEAPVWPKQLHFQCLNLKHILIVLQDTQLR